jgi:putative hydrolase of the HAD superfamily
MSPIDTVLLDAGGVLLDLDFRYLRKLLRSRGHDVDEPALARAEGRARTEMDRRVREGGRGSEAWRDYFRALLAGVRAPVDLHEPVIDVLWEAHDRVGLWNSPVEGSPSVVRELKRRNLRLGVVSNAEGRVERDLCSAGYDGLFETVVDSHLVGVEKPDPEIFRIALERMGARPETCVFVGDVPAIDVAGARAAGIAPILLDRFDLYPGTDAPRLRFLAQLPAWLDGGSISFRT